MKKNFIVVGELSGDRTAAWYVNKRMQQDAHCYWEAVGGNFLHALGVVLYERFEKLNVTGVFEVVIHVLHMLRMMRRMVEHIVKNKFDEVVLVDFPTFNLMLAKKLKRVVPHIKITYVSPPQLWCWGAWRVKKIKALCDDVIVIYPFEVDWYKKHGVEAQWLGCPVYDALIPFVQNAIHREPIVALIPGSRPNEIKYLLPVLAAVARNLYQKYPQLKFIMPIAQSLQQDFMERQLRKVGLLESNIPITMVKDDAEKYQCLQSCCLAITKPGTVTLELALLGVPAVVFFKISWPTYLLGRSLIKVKQMALPNLFLDNVAQPYPECIQHNCTPDKITRQADRVLASFFGDKVSYNAKMELLGNIRMLLKTP